MVYEAIDKNLHLTIQFRKHDSLRQLVCSVVMLLSLSLSGGLFAHDKQATASYLANEAVLISVGNHKVLFDPFFHNDYGIYQLVPQNILKAVMSNAKPYHDIDLIFVSHAHSDHFAATDMLAYLLKYKSVKLVAPDQAIDELAELPGFDDIKSRTTSISLEYGDPPISFEVANIKIESVRIPHAGWPGRAEVSNLVYRVTLPYFKEMDVSENTDRVEGEKQIHKHEHNAEKQTLSFLHMGDADPNDRHFQPLSAFWDAQETDVAFPPYWFFLTNTGNYILDYRINTKHAIGVHVPKKIPAALTLSGKAFFSTPGDVFTLIDK